MKKLLIALPLLVLLLTWGHHGAQQAEAQVEACCFPDGSCQNLNFVDCMIQGGSPGGPGSVCLGVEACYYPDGSCANMDALCCLNQGDTPGGSGSVCLGVEACCYPDGSCGDVDAGLCLLQGGSPGGPGSVCLGVEACCYPDGSCADMDALCCLDDGGTPQGSGTNCAGVTCQAQPPDLSIRVDAAGCNTAGGPTTCYVPVSTQFTVTMNVDVLPPLTGDYNVFQGYLDYSLGLTWVDRIGDPPPEILLVCDIEAEAPGAGYYLGGCSQVYSPPLTQTGAVMEVDYTCGASPSTETVTMVHGSPSNTFLIDGNGQLAAEAGSESLTIECYAPPPDEVKWRQPPDESPWGLDVGTLSAIFSLVLAEDFLCTESGLITQVAFWASWYGDAPPGGNPALVQFTLSLHSDVPAGEDLPYSHPGDLLWLHTFTSYECMAQLWSTGEEGWFYPPEDYYEPGADSQIWFYQCSIPDEYWFQQEKDTIYWLDIQPIPIAPGYYFGWKTSTNHWNDDGVWALGPEPVDPLDWSELRYPPGHPKAGASIDLAFEIWGQECNPLLDIDGDTFNDAVECYLGTDRLDDCPDVIGAHDALPFDINMDRYITVVEDVLAYAGKILPTPVSSDPPGSGRQRLDLNMDDYITVVEDVLMFAGKILPDPCT